MSNYESLNVGDKVLFKNKIRPGYEPNYYQFCNKIFEVTGHFQDKQDGKVFEHYVNLKCVSNPDLIVGPVYDTELKAA